MRKFVLATRLSDKDYGVKTHQNQSKCFAVKQTQMPPLIPQLLEPDFSAQICL